MLDSDANFIALSHNMMPALLELHDLMKDMVEMWEAAPSQARSAFLEEMFDSASFALDQINLEN